MLRAVSLTVALVVGASAPVLAAGTSSEEARPTKTLSAAIERAAGDAVASTPEWAIDRPERRPATLPVLYGTYAALQTLDVVTTKHALAAGATEANPLLKSGGSARTFAIKASAGAATIFFAERAWKKNRVGAVVLMAVLNGASAAIVARNARHAAR